MKGALVSTAIAAMAGVVMAGHGHRQAHELLARNKGTEMEACKEMCSTTITTYYGEATCKCLWVGSVAHHLTS